MIRSVRRLAAAPVPPSWQTRPISSQQLALVSAVGVGVGVVLLGVRNHLQQDNTPPLVPTTFSVMTWNVLARPYTIYNRKFHRAQGKVEDEDQTRTRYTLAAEQISSHASDLVFMQECEAEFFDPRWNLVAEKLLAQYKVFRCSKDTDPGTAVLVKEGGLAESSASEPFCVGGSEETGGASKIATIVPVRVGPRELAAVSVHFAFDGMAEKRKKHVDLIGQQLQQAGLRERSVVLGGDFNCEPGARLSELEASSFLGGLQRAPLPEGPTQQGRATGLSSDFSSAVCIDHVYTSSDLGEPSATVLAWPASPWGGKVSRPAKVSGASDHVPVVVKLQLP